MFDRFVNKVNRWQKERKTIDELGRLTDRELSDIGLSRADIRSVVRSR